MKNQFRYVKLTDQLLFKTRFPKMHYNIRGSCLIHGTKHRNDYQFRSWELPCNI